MSYSDSLIKVEGVVARLLIEWKDGQDSIRREPTAESRKLARLVMTCLSQLMIIKRWRSKELAALSPDINDVGVLVTRGRLGCGMKSILGQSELAILPHRSRLAILYMWAAHRLMHRATPAETAAASRRYAWILQAKRLAKSICQKCMLCRSIHIHLGKQIMGSRKPEHLLQAPPFTFTACDLLGPFKCRGMVNARGSLKVWGVIYVCQGTGGVRSYLCPGYSTSAFLIAHGKFLAHCGNPATITSDRGSQLKKSARVLEYTDAQDPAKWEWDAISAAGAKQGTTWIFIPPGTQWRNRAEAAVKVMKRTMDLTLNSQDKLNFAELETLLMSIANIMNERPLAVRTYDENNFQPLTVNQLLLGRTTTNISTADYRQDGSSLERLEFCEELETTWWRQFHAQVLPMLVPLSKWKQEYPNRKVGDIVLVHYPGIKKADYRIARVSEVQLDEKGLVRTVEVLMRPRDKRVDGNAKYTHKDLQPLLVPVQRVALLMPVEEVNADRPVDGDAGEVGDESDGVEVLHANVEIGPDLVIPAQLTQLMPAMQLKDYDSYACIQEKDQDLQFK